MVDCIITFLHTADTHFGLYWAKNPRNHLKAHYSDIFFEKGEKIIQEAIQKYNVDFIIHAGDFFNRSKPPPEVIDRAVKPFSFASNKGIPIYLLPGNHERGKLPFGLLHYHDHINIFDKPSSFMFQKNGIIIQLTGFPYIRYNINKKFDSVIGQASKYGSGNPPHYNILVLHQLIEGSKVQNYTFNKGFNVIQSNNIFNKYNYIACGHVHRFQFLYPSDRLKTYNSTNEYRFVNQNCIERTWQLFNSENKTYQVSAKFNDPIIVYPGSLDRISMAERSEPKGFIIGKLFYSEKSNKIVKAEITFKMFEAMNMIYEIWNFSTKSSEEYIEALLEKMKAISLNSSITTKKINGVARIKIEGIKNLSKTEYTLLKQKSKKLKIYLTFSGFSNNLVKK